MLIYNQIGQRTRTFKGLVVLEDSLYLTPESEDSVFLTQPGSVNLVHRYGADTPSHKGQNGC